jgi:hypothetical protein
VKLAKLTTAISGALTVFCAVTLAGLEAAACLTEGVWEPYRLSSILASLQNDRNSYFTASVKRDHSQMIDWFLGVPTISLLAIVAAAHFVFYSYLVEFEKRAFGPSHH